MALVRCEKHNIPYNDSNPRGCPACAREEGGDNQATIMAELARASRRVDAISEPLPPLETVAAPPTPVETAVRSIKRPVLLFGIPAVLLLMVLLMRLTGPRFVEQPSPVAEASEIRPLTLVPGQPIAVLFAQLGAQQPQVHPSVRRIQRYYYGADLIFDTVNDVLYSFEIQVPNRIWRGLRVGLSQQEAQGAMALLGTATTTGPQTITPNEIGDYLVFPSLEQRPRRTITTEVRPPNGCYDVTVDVQPRSIGNVFDDGQSYTAIGRRGDTPSWTVTRIQVASRSMAGPLSGPPEC